MDVEPLRGGALKVVIDGSSEAFLRVGSAAFMFALVLESRDNRGRANALLAPTI